MKNLAKIWNSRNSKNIPFHKIIFSMLVSVIKSTIYVKMKKFHYINIPKVSYLKKLPLKVIYRVPTTQGKPGKLREKFGFYLISRKIQGRIFLSGLKKKKFRGYFFCICPYNILNSSAFLLHLKGLIATCLIQYKLWV